MWQFVSSRCQKLERSWWILVIILLILEFVSPRSSCSLCPHAYFMRILHVLTFFSDAIFEICIKVVVESKKTISSLLKMSVSVVSVCGIHTGVYVNIWIGGQIAWRWKVNAMLREFQANFIEFFKRIWSLIFLLLIHNQPSTRPAHHHIFQKCEINLFPLQAACSVHANTTTPATMTPLFGTKSWE